MPVNTLIGLPYSQRENMRSWRKHRPQLRMFSIMVEQDEQRVADCGNVVPRAVRGCDRPRLQRPVAAVNNRVFDVKDGLVDVVRGYVEQARRLVPRVVAALAMT